MFEISNEELARRGLTRAEFVEIERLKIDLVKATGQEWPHLRAYKIQKAIRNRGWTYEWNDASFDALCYVYFGNGQYAEGRHSKFPAVSLAYAFLRALQNKPGA